MVKSILTALFMLAAVRAAAAADGASAVSTAASAGQAAPAAAAASPAAPAELSTSPASAACSGPGCRPDMRPIPLKGRQLFELLPRLDDTMEKRTRKTLRVYKGSSDGVEVNRVKMPPDAHWRLVWKFEVKDKEDAASFKISVRASGDGAYVQGVTKEILRVEEAAFGLLNVCYERGGEFLIQVESKGAKWDVAVQRLI